MPASRSIDIVMCFNSMHFVGAMAAIRSIVVNTERPRDVSFHIVVGADESEDFRAWIRRCFPDPVFSYEVREFSPAPFLEDFLQAAREYTYAAYESQVMNFARLYLHQLYPRLKKFIYLDADLIVRGDVIELLEHANLEVHPLAAVPHGSFKAWRSRIQEGAEILEGLDFGGPRFNNGVYVADLEQWQEQGFLAQLEAWVEKHRRALGAFPIGTQSLMNLTFMRNFQQLPLEWNVRRLGNDPAIPAKTLESAKILHWTGKTKPWDVDGFYKEYWLDYACDAALDEEEPQS